MEPKPKFEGLKPKFEGLTGYLEVNRDIRDIYEMLGPIRLPDYAWRVRCSCGVVHRWRRKKVGKIKNARFRVEHGLGFDGNRTDTWVCRYCGALVEPGWLVEQEEGHIAGMKIWKGSMEYIAPAYPRDFMGWVSELSPPLLDEGRLENYFGGVQAKIVWKTKETCGRDWQGTFTIVGDVLFEG